MAFGRLFRWTAPQIPTSEIGPAQGPFPPSLVLPAADQDDEDEGPERLTAAERAAARPPRPVTTGEPILKRGNLLGDLVFGVLNAIANLAVGQATRPIGGPQGLAILRRIAPPTAAAPAHEPDPDVDERTPVAQRVQQDDPWAQRTTQLRAESAARAVAIERDIEILGTSNVAADRGAMNGNAITLDRSVVGADQDEAYDVGGRTAL